MVRIPFGLYAAEVVSGHMKFEHSLVYPCSKQRMDGIRSVMEDQFMGKCHTEDKRHANIIVECDFPSKETKRVKAFFKDRSLMDLDIGYKVPCSKVKQTVQNIGRRH